MKDQPKKTQQSPVSTCHSPSGWLSPLSPYILQTPSLPSNVPSIIFLSLLEHLHFTIIPHYRSFFSDLLSLYSTILSLHENIIMDKSCKLEMGLWHNLFFSMTIYGLWLSSRASTDGLVPAKQAWLILRVLYDNHLTQHKDFQLEANTAPLIRFWRCSMAAVVQKCCGISAHLTIQERWRRLRDTDDLHWSSFL